MKKLFLLTIPLALLFIAGTAIAGTPDGATGPWADTVVNFDQGLRKNDTAVLTERSDPSQILGPAENDDTVNFVSLGFGGTLILGFDNCILNGEDEDIEIVETSYGSPDCGSYPETVRIYASQDNSSWEDLGTSCLDGACDLGSLAWAKYIKLIDESNTADFGGTADGIDIDGVQALHSAETCPVEPVVCPDGMIEKHLETVVVPSDGSTVDSDNILKSGVNYILEASGTYIYWPAQLPDAGKADAKYSLRPEGNNNPGPGPQWVSGDDLAEPWTNFLEVLVDGLAVDWGLFNPEHIYRLLLEGTDSQIAFRIVDSYYGDNSGSLEVDIYKCVCPGDVEVNNFNWAVVHNDLTVVANSGGNSADGGETNGGDGAKAKAMFGSHAISFGSGGNGGNGGSGGNVSNTGNTYAKGKVINRINNNYTRVRW